MIVQVLVYDPSCAHTPAATKSPGSFTIFATSLSQLSMASGNADCASTNPATLLQSRFTSRVLAAVIQTGAVSSWMVITWVNTVEAFPHASVAIHVLVKLPS